MTWTHGRLVPALATSLLLHALPFLPGLLPSLKPPARPPALEAHLKPSPPPLPAQPPLRLPEPTKPPKLSPPRPAQSTRAQPPAPQIRENWTAAVKRQLKDMDRRGQFYPEEAIARGLEGEAVVLLVLDEEGNAVAARIEQSSGHKILDDAALRAARSLKTLPADAPRQTYLPVRFRLR